MTSTSNAEHRDEGRAEPHAITQAMPYHRVNHVAIFVFQVVLTLATVAFTFVHVESILIRTLIILGIAAVNGAAVAYFLMHLRFEGKLIYLILLVPLFLAAVLIAGLIPDGVFGNRSPGPTPFPAMGK